MILFLDFDGVLHPLFTRPELPPEEAVLLPAEIRGGTTRLPER